MSIPQVSHSDGVPVIPEATPTSNQPSGTITVLPVSFYAQFLSNEAKERKPSPIRGLFPLENIPGIISLLAGKPNPVTFPLTSLSFTVRSPTDPTKETQLSLNAEDLAGGLQYGPTDGQPALLEWIYKLQELSHSRKKGEGWRVTMGSGSQDLINKAVIAIVNDGDSVLLESPMYAGVIPMFQILHCDQTEVPTDANGICSSDLRLILESWPAGKPKPKVLYTVPFGCNPTGMTASIERRKEVLQLAKEHNFIIFEDDPYYYLYYGEAARPPSYFELELQEAEVGRVLRFDSLSKIVSAGLRIGFASGPAPLLTAMDMHTATANLQVSSLTQAITNTLLQSWGHEGFMAHTRSVCEFYKAKRDIFERALKKHLTGLAEWETPEAGMFVWFKLLLGEHGDSQAVISTKAVERGVLALPGTVFLPNGGKTAYVRAAFSLVTEEDVDEAVKRLRDTVLDVQKELASAL